MITVTVQKSVYIFDKFFRFKGGIGIVIEASLVVTK